jgi:uncharacterized protein (UPF0147 family)
MNMDGIDDPVPLYPAPDVLRKKIEDKHASSADRLEAIEVAGDCPADEGLADTLAAIVRDKSEELELRARAAISLGPALEMCEIEGFDEEDPFAEPPLSEQKFQEIEDTLHRIYSDEKQPKEIRRRVLEASVRAPQEWHPDAVRVALASGDEEWKLTAVFAMRWIDGFDREILEALNSKNPEIHAEAIQAAGKCRLDEAWPHVEKLVRNRRTEKDLLIPAIVAVAEIRPREAGSLLMDLADSKDEDIAEAAMEAMSDARSEIEFEESEEESDEDWDEDDEDEEEEE